MDNTAKKLPDNKQFLVDVMSAIERKDKLDRNRGSQWYKPSSLHCMRNMYFTRIGAEQDTSVTEYKSIGMADTGTRRHEAIQDVLVEMLRMGYDWEYVDVADYVAKKQAQGKCKTLVVKEKVGAETKLFDTALKISFRCDGIIRKVSTNEFFLFEFKNQTSFKFRDKETIDEAHIQQVVCYCTALDLDKAFVLYENRDVCELECPELFIVTDEMKQTICVDHLMECESYVERMIPPPKNEDSKKCRWCQYKTACKKAGG